MEPKGINFVWTGKGFGNALILAHLTKICVDNGIPAVFNQHRTTINLVDVPLYDPTFHAEYLTHTWKGVRNTWTRKNVDMPVISQYIKNVEDIFDTKIRMTKIHSHIPVAYHDIPEITGVDVAMCTEVGAWGPYRNWPYFPELKKLFDQSNISYVDLNKDGIYSIECLNYVKKSKLYIGLETGMSHYVSKFANHKALIIQSGFCPFIFWAYPYHYECITANTECTSRPCFITRNEVREGRVCLNQNSCMAEIKPETIFIKVKECL